MFLYVNGTFRIRTTDLGKCRKGLYGKIYEDIYVRTKYMCTKIEMELCYLLQIHVPIDTLLQNCVLQSIGDRSTNPLIS
jgi:hypothetical protein